jgi:hypothetical protein
MKTNYDYQELEETVLQITGAVVEIAGEFATFHQCYQEQPERLKAALHAGVVAYLQRAATDDQFPRADRQFTPQFLNLPIPGADDLAEMLVRLAQFQVEDHATRLVCDDVTPGTRGWRKCEPSSMADLPNGRALYAEPDVACPDCGKPLDEILG